MLARNNLPFANDSGSAAFESTARQVLAGVDATLPLTGITTYLRMIEQSLAQPRLLRGQWPLSTR